MRRLFQIGLIVLFVVAAGYALVLITLLILSSVVRCGCVATPSPSLP